MKTLANAKTAKLSKFANFQKKLREPAQGGRFKNFLVKAEQIIRHPIFSCNYRYWNAAAKLKESEAKVSLLSNNTENLEKVLYLAVHDAKNAIAASKGTFELMLMEDMMANDHDMRELVESNVSSMDCYIKDVENLLNWVKLNGKPLPAESLELGQFIKYGPLVSLQACASTHGLGFEVEAEKEVRAMANSAVLSRVIENIVSNSMKFTPEGGSVKIRIWGNCTNAFISVQDSGVGIPAKLLETSSRGIPKIFVLGESRSEQDLSGHTGTAVGLPVCYSFAKSMGGSLSAANNAGNGATFTLTLPRAQE